MTFASFSLPALILLLLVLALSAFFSGMEIAYLSSDRLRLEVDLSRQKGISKKALRMLFRNPERYVTTMLLGNNIVLVMYGLLMSLLLDPYLEQFITSDGVVLVVDLLISTIIIIIFGEYLPKAYFKRDPNSTLSFFSLPAIFFYLILYPITWLSSVLSKGLLLLLGVKNSGSIAHRQHTTVDLDHYLSDTLAQEDEGTLDTEVKIIQNAMEFSQVRARDCMVPRREVVACDLETSMEDLRALFVSTGLSKVIVYSETIDNVVGYIHSSEMFRGEGWQQRMKKALFVPESTFGQKLMMQLMQRKQSIAIVVDELGGTAGIVTMEDLVEEIFGDFEDEHDKKKLTARKIDNKNYLFSARCEIDFINEQYNINLPESEEYNTLGGLILSTHGDIPNTGEIIEVGRFRFTILRALSTRIELVKVTLID